MHNPPRTKYQTGRREIEDEADSDPYADGPIEILPGVYLGAEDNATDSNHLRDRSIGAVLNVAKEVVLSFESEPSETVLPERGSDDDAPSERLYPANDTTGRPDLHYLHLQWSHGQNDLVEKGFIHGLAFIDRCLAANRNVLIQYVSLYHLLAVLSAELTLPCALSSSCQCGISRSATMMIAYVMRESRSPSAPPNVAKLAKEGMHGAYTYVKSKSSTVGPNLT